MINEVLIISTHVHEHIQTCLLRVKRSIKDNILLDMYIAPHVNNLYTQIRNRALIQYFSPYLSADMRRMATAFNRTVSALEDELMQLILDGQIQARIDSHNKVIFTFKFFLKLKHFIILINIFPFLSDFVRQRCGPAKHYFRKINKSRKRVSTTNKDANFEVGDVKKSNSSKGKFRKFNIWHEYV